ncbi:hypothetical protein BQ8794_50275 [Mesorhizobium prunaredense]|uniref:Uncharacterized protein n=1 Tax=Mesorhizobium prunaredense TaxID=1631249 RepID=A0A1R3VFZ0_9HYPH|nr:hypothetical protein BQ8794_50275 [Mesorhizobium prunaredense]
MVAEALRVAMGFAIAFLSDQSKSPRYFGTRSTGKTIDDGLVWLMIGAALGKRQRSAARWRRKRTPSVGLDAHL